MQYEGLRLESYRCPAGVWTIGYGHTKGVKEGVKITEAEAEQLLAEDCKYYERMVGLMVTEPLSDLQMDALECLAYNIGVSALRGSTLMRLINAGEQDELRLREAWSRWVYAGNKRLAGLERRRQAEADMYFS